MDKACAAATGWRSWLTSRRVTKTFPGTLTLAFVLLIVTLAVSILAVPKGKPRCLRPLAYCHLHHRAILGARVVALALRSIPSER